VIILIIQDVSIAVLELEGKSLPLTATA